MLVSRLLEISERNFLIRTISKEAYFQINCLLVRRRPIILESSILFIVESSSPSFMTIVPRPLSIIVPSFIIIVPRKKINKFSKNFKVRS